jgi:hypothetical protein
MAATYVTKQELIDNLGIGTLYPDADVESVCQTAEDLLNQFLWFNTAPVVATGISGNIATIVIASPGMFVVGQSVAITASGSNFNGTRTITGVGPSPIPNNANWAGYPYNYPRGYQYLQFAIVNADIAMHQVQPYGKMSGPDDKIASYALTGGVRQAAMILAVSIWQSRQSTQSGGMSVDGFSPSPFKMSNTLMASIRGLIAPYMTPNSMVG